MTPFALLCDLAGLSQREAAEMLAVSPSSIDKMGRGVRATPPGLIGELQKLIAEQERGARAMIDLAGDCQRGEMALEFPSTDTEARAMGWQCVGAFRGMAARVIATASLPVTLTPRAQNIAAK